MTNNTVNYDVIIIGGGFYGSVIAVYLSKRYGFKKILLVERESKLLSRASYNNQARVHNGYHYPRSFTTAYRSRVNFPKFVKDWPSAVEQEFTKLYAIARRNSKVSAKQFIRFCREIGASVKPASTSQKSLFDALLIEDVFLVNEFAFDSTELAQWSIKEMNQSGVNIRLSTQATEISRGSSSSLEVLLQSRISHLVEKVSSNLVFNCTYSGLNQFSGDFSGTRTRLKHEITEMALVKMPPNLADLGITVMDGPFFSTMPFPARQLHTLSHVRYTPHLYWNDEASLDPYLKLVNYDRVTRVDRMLRDVSRYVPSIRRARYVDSLFEIKTVLVKNESDDGRPILFEKHTELPGCYSVLGGKIDNVYDVLEKLDKEDLVAHCGESLNRVSYV